MKIIHKAFLSDFCNFAELSTRQATTIMLALQIGAVIKITKIIVDILFLFLIPKGRW